MTAELAILADDLTGAADSGAVSADAGLVTIIPLLKMPFPAADVIIANSNTRDLEVDEVAARIAAAVDLILADGRPLRWFKKIDSALRGHVALELDLLMDQVGCSLAVVCPTLPSQGRIVVDGTIQIDGEFLHRTSLGVHCASSNLPEVFAAETSRNIQHIDLAVVKNGAAEIGLAIANAETGIVVADAKSESDLDAIAQAMISRPDILMVGSAGLAGALFRTCSIRSRGYSLSPPRAKTGPILIVSGTRHQATANQINFAERQGVAVVRPNRVETWKANHIDEMACAVTHHLHRGIDTILTVTGCPAADQPGIEIAHGLAAAAGAAMARQSVSGLVVTGGDIAAAVCSALNVEYLLIRGEVLPAIPWATLGGGCLPNLPVVTKAGSFGEEDALFTSAGFLHQLKSLR